MRSAARISEVEYNKLSVRLELQADFYAGVVFHHAQREKNILEPGDIEEGLRAAAAIGDDTLQKRGQGYANQETFTHGTSEQRVRWFMKGLQTGDPDQGDTVQRRAAVTVSMCQTPLTSSRRNRPRTYCVQVAEPGPLSGSKTVSCSPTGRSDLPNCSRRSSA